MERSEGRAARAMIANCRRTEADLAEYITLTPDLITPGITLGIESADSRSPTGGGTGRGPVRLIEIGGIFAVPGGESAESPRAGVLGFCRASRRRDSR